MGTPSIQDPYFIGILGTPLVSLNAMRMNKGNEQGFENVIVSKVVRIWVALPLHKSIDTLQYRGIRVSSIYGQVFYSSALCSC